MDPGYAHASKNVAKNSVFTFVNASKTGVHFPGLSTYFLFHLPLQRVQKSYRNCIIFIYLQIKIITEAYIDKCIICFYNNIIVYENKLTYIERVFFEDQDAILKKR